jgi:hypothetical protein
MKIAPVRYSQTSGLASMIGMPAFSSTNEAGPVTVELVSFPPTEIGVEMKLKV